MKSPYVSEDDTGQSVCQSVLAQAHLDWISSPVFPDWKISYRQSYNMKHNS